MTGIQSDGRDTAGGVAKADMGLACTGVGGPAALRPHRPPRPIGGPVWVVRACGLGYVLLGVFMTAEMPIVRVGEESAWPITVSYWAAGPLLIISVPAAAVSWWRARRQAGGVVAGRHT